MALLPLSVPADIIDNTAFVPGRHAAPAHQTFRGTLHLAEVEMTTHPANLNAHQVLGKDAQYFPGFAVDFITVDGDLVPATEEVIRAGSRRGGRSYWDYAPINRTIETDGIPAQPLMAYGYYATISDLVNVARLYHDRGRHGGVQLFYEPRIDELQAGTTPRGLPTGQKTRFGETTYFNAFWEMRYDARIRVKDVLHMLAGERVSFAWRPRKKPYLHPIAGDGFLSDQ
jgi:hypothetical protein